MSDPNSFYRPDRTNEPAEPTMAELRERQKLCAQIAKDIAAISTVDLAELEVLQKRVAAILADLKAIKDDETVRELQKNA